MKVLKYGDGYPKTVICEHCNSELEYNAEDIHIHTDVYIERTETFRHITCPVCAEEIVVDVKFVERQSLNQKKENWWTRWI